MEGDSSGGAPADDGLNSTDASNLKADMLEEAHSSHNLHKGDD